MPGDSRPSVLIDTGGDALFISFFKEDYHWTFHSVKHGGVWGDVDLILRINQAYNQMDNEWLMFVQDSMLFSEHVTVDENDNIIQRYDNPPIPVPQMKDRLHLDTYDWQMFPQNPSWLVSGEMRDFESVNALVPKGWTVRNVEISSLGIILLGKDEQGETRLLLKRWMSEESITLGYYRDTITLPLPEEAYMHDIYLYLSPSGPGFSLAHSKSGGWRVAYVMGSGNNWFEIHPTFLYFGMEATTQYAFGSMPSLEVDTLDFTKLPLTYEDAFQLMDQSNWAMVNNPDSANTLHLREKPERGSTSLGKFYNGTPVKVLERKGEWVQVELADLSGWMLADYLAFGADMNQVVPAYPGLTGLESLENKPMPLYSRPDESSTVIAKHDITNFHPYVWIIGVVDDEWFYVYYAYEDLGGYMKQAWFWEGNG